MLSGNSINTYHEKTELYLEYSHLNTLLFGRIQLAWVKQNNKNQDLFIIGDLNEKWTALNYLKGRIIRAGFSKVILINLDTGQEEVIAAKQNNPERIYRFIISKKVIHDDMINLLGISEQLCGITGDQSLGEAISANKFFLYECMQHKDDLVSGFEEIARRLKLSIKFRTLLSLFHYKSVDKTGIENLFTDPEVINDFVTFNSYIQKNKRLEPVITSAVANILIQGKKITKSTDLIEQALIDGNQTILK